MALPLSRISLTPLCKNDGVSHIPRAEPVTIAVRVSVGVAYLRVHRDAWVETRGKIVTLEEARQKAVVGK